MYMLNLQANIHANIHANIRANVHATRTLVHTYTHTHIYTFIHTQYNNSPFKHTLSIYIRYYRARTLITNTTIGTNKELGNSMLVDWNGRNSDHSKSGIILQAGICMKFQVESSAFWFFLAYLPPHIPLLEDEVFFNYHFISCNSTKHQPCEMYHFLFMIVHVFIFKRFFLHYFR